jgi:hypothetical protein
MDIGGRIPPLLDAFAQLFCIILPSFEFLAVASHDHTPSFHKKYFDKGFGRRSFPNDCCGNGRFPA